MDGVDIGEVVFVVAMDGKAIYSPCASARSELQSSEAALEWNPLSLFLAQQYILDLTDSTDLWREQRSSARCTPRPVKVVAEIGQRSARADRSTELGVGRAAVGRGEDVGSKGPHFLFFATELALAYRVAEELRIDSQEIPHPAPSHVNECGRRNTSRERLKRYIELLI
ncbi:hypothetical protein MIND_00975800 [Mycena indigotica]|uniref:Uncharacterized protein n=1 Tax=Mycena indigotica TaxID=2126181 RepID=A0A8H6VXF8_9AGAR|nr:uncharacterized protein MIND_00975800 [Mycena indigotica]KAF7297422.1 hypothetical protein MIND_00975800 [Mycena indigotica]